MSVHSAIYAMATRTDAGFGALFVLLLVLIFAWNRFKAGGDSEPMQIQLAVNPWVLIGWLVFCLLFGSIFLFADIHFSHPALIGVAIPFLLCVIALCLARLRL